MILSGIVPYHLESFQKRPAHDTPTINWVGISGRRGRQASILLKSPQVVRWMAKHEHSWSILCHFWHRRECHYLHLWPFKSTSFWQYWWGWKRKQCYVIYFVQKYLRQAALSQGQCRNCLRWSYFLWNVPPLNLWKRIMCIQISEVHTFPKVKFTFFFLENLLGYSIGICLTICPGWSTFLYPWLDFHFNVTFHFKVLPILVIQ